MSHYCVMSDSRMCQHVPMRRSSPRLISTSSLICPDDDVILPTFSRLTVSDVRQRMLASHPD